MNKNQKHTCIMAVDAGNSRVKWQGELKSGDKTRNFVTVSDLGDIKPLWTNLRKPEVCVISNVAGPRLEEKFVSACFALWGIEPIFVKSQRACCGVTNHYYEPHSLGSDRWAALIGAHDLELGDSLVITLGTASTVDVLYNDGNFMGGIIFPGLDLMGNSLSQETYALKNFNGKDSEFPRNTVDAIYSGSMRATAGAIEAMRLQVLMDRGKSPQLVFSGGNAQKVAKHCHKNRSVHDNLVIDGLIRVSRDLV